MLKEIRILVLKVPADFASHSYDSLASALSDFERGDQSLQRE
jgi:hypothetical protein